MKLNIRDLIIDVINREKILINVYFLFFLEFKYMFYV